MQLGNKIYQLGQVLGTTPTVQNRSRASLTAPAITIFTSPGTAVQGIDPLRQPTLPCFWTRAPRTRARSKWHRQRVPAPQCLLALGILLGAADWFFKQQNQPNEANLIFGDRIESALINYYFLNVDWWDLGMFDFPWCLVNQPRYHFGVPVACFIQTHSQASFWRGSNENLWSNKKESTFYSVENC